MYVLSDREKGIPGEKDIKTIMTTLKKTKFKKSDDQTYMDKYGVAQTLQNIILDEN